MPAAPGQIAGVESVLEDPMSDEDDDGPDDEEDDDESGEGKKDPKAGKRKMMAIIAAALVVVGGGAGAYFAGLFDSLLGEGSGSKMASIELGAPVIHDLPRIKADLKTGRCRAPFLRTVVAVELGSNDLPRLQAFELRVVDAVRTYLRDQERQDMVGKQGTEKLRFDITNIINNLIAPARIHAVIFKEFLVQ